MLNCQCTYGKKIPLQGRILPQISIFKQLYTYRLPILIFGNTNPKNVCNLFLFGDAQAPTCQRNYNGIASPEPSAIVHKWSFHALETTNVINSSSKTNRAHVAPFPLRYCRNSAPRSRTCATSSGEAGECANYSSSTRKSI